MPGTNKSSILCCVTVSVVYSTPAMLRQVVYSFASGFTFCLYRASKSTWSKSLGSSRFSWEYKQPWTCVQYYTRMWPSRFPGIYWSFLYEILNGYLNPQIFLQQFFAQLLVSPKCYHCHRWLQHEAVVTYCCWQILSEKKAVWVDWALN